MVLRRHSQKKICLQRRALGTSSERGDCMMGQWFSGGQVYDFFADALLLTTTVEFLKCILFIPKSNFFAPTSFPRNM